MFQIAYNGRGVMIKPIVIHGDELIAKVTDHFAPYLGFIQTVNGKLNYDVPLRLLEYIDAYV